MVDCLTASGHTDTSSHDNQRGRETMALRTEIVDDLRDLRLLREPWQRLLGASPSATVFGTPAWVLTWFDYFAEQGVHAVTVWDGDELVGIAPFVRTSFGLPLARTCLLATVGSEHGYYGEPILGPPPVHPVAAAIAGHLERTVRRGRTAVNLRRLWTGGAMHDVLLQLPGATCQPMASPSDSAVLRFGELPDVDAYFRKLARRHGIRRRARRMDEHFDVVEYTPADPAIDDALDDMRAMLRRRWAPGTGPRLFTGARRRAFTKEVIKELAADGHAEVSVLRADGSRVAMSVLFRVGDRCFNDYTAFDPAFAEFGVGNRELYECLRHAYDEGATEVDLSAVSGFEYKLRWANTTVSSQSVTLLPTGWRHGMASAGRRVAMSYRARHLARLERTPARV